MDPPAHCICAGGFLIRLMSLKNIIDESDVTKDMIFEICANGNTKNFDKI